MTQTTGISPIFLLKGFSLTARFPIRRDKAYYEALGYPRAILSPVDFYRLKRARKYLYGKSVLDVGCGRADFLNLIKNNYQIAGVEVNTQRVDYCNQVLEQDAVRLGNLDGELDFEHGSFDTVVCLEVLEHLEDPAEALKELMRVSRKRIIITIPFNQKIQYVLCIHCAKYTPYWGHLHTFNKENIEGIIPDNVKIVKMELICSRATTVIPGFRCVFRLPVLISSTIDRILNQIIPKAGWMMVVLDKNSDTK